MNPDTLEPVLFQNTDDVGNLTGLSFISYPKFDLMLKTADQRGIDRSIILERTFYLYENPKFTPPPKAVS